MNGTWKDVLTTILAIAIGTLYYTKLHTIFPWHLSNRWVIVLLAFVGILMCAMGSPAVKTNPLTYLLTGLGIIALSTIIIGLVTGKQLFVTLLIIEIMLLWIFSTVRHLLF